jgi:hypothetical protein
MPKVKSQSNSKRAPFQEPPVSCVSPPEKRTDTSFRFLPTQEEIQARLADEWDDWRFWEERLNILERMICDYTKKAAWSAEIMLKVNELEEEIQECLEHLERLSYA